MRRRLLRLRLLGLRLSWLRTQRHITSRPHWRTTAALTAIIGLVATAAGVQATAASWADSANSAIEVSTATTTTTTSTTVPPVLASVSVTAVCKNQSTYRLQVTSDAAQPLQFTLQTGTILISGPHTIPAGGSQTYEIPNGTSGVAAVSDGSWTNTFTGTASTPTAVCATPPTTTTTTSPPTTTTTLPPTGVSSGGISAGNADTIVAGISWDVARARQVCTVVSVTGIDSTARDWAVLLDLTQPPWYGTSPDRLVLSGSGTLTTLSPTTMLLTGRSNPGKFNSRTNNTPITNSQTALLEICNHQAPVPTDLPGSYEATTEVGVWTDTTACVTVTVTSTRTDLATFPFHFGWAATVDLSGAVAHFTAGQNLSFTFTPKANGSNDYAVAPLTEEYTYQITNGYDSALRALGGGADSFSVTACVNAT